MTVSVKASVSILVLNAKRSEISLVIKVSQSRIVVQPCSLTNLIPDTGPTIRIEQFVSATTQIHCHLWIVVVTLDLWKFS